MVSVSQHLTLPCRRTAMNRLIKSATTEGLADVWNRVTERHLALYTLWSQAGAGILVSGNIQVDRRYLERAGNVAIDKDYPDSYDERQREMLKRWASVSKAKGSLFLAQLSCSGPKTPSYVTEQTVGPSDVVVAATATGEKPGQVRALTVTELDALVEKWVHAALVITECGWDGVQVHAAHSYLVSSFLSPHLNKREDEYGGSLENRARLLLRVVEGIRTVVPRTFILSVKIHCSDFEDVGFKHAECAIVCGWLAEAGVDLIEFSGNIGAVLRQRALKQPLGDTAPTSPGSQGAPRASVWFPDHVATIKATGKCGAVPVCITGGFVNMPQVEDVLRSGTADMVGMARPFCAAPEDLYLRFADGSPEKMEKINRGPEFTALLWIYHQLQRLADGHAVDWDIEVKAGIQKQMEYHAAWAVDYKKTLFSTAKL